MYLGCGNIKVGEGKIVDNASADIVSGIEGNGKERPVYGKNLLAEAEAEAGGDEKIAGLKEGQNNILKKSDILLGKDKRETVHLDHYDKNVVIRPLTDGELSQVFDIIGNVPLNEDGLPDLNMVDISTNLRALRMITALGLVEPEMTEDDVAEMRFGTPGILAKHILELSGLTETVGDDAEKFRPDA